MSVRNPLAGVPLRAARWSATHPWRAILAWFVFVLVAVGLAIAIPTQEPTDADYRLGESGRADAMVDAAGLDGADTENVLITARGDAVVDQQAAESAAAEIRRDMAATDGVDAVSEPQWNPDQSALLMEIQLAKDQEDVSQLVAVTERVQDEQPGLEIRQAGDITIDESIDERVADDLSSAEKISIPVTLVLMLLAFGALIAAGIPVLIAVTSVAATIGITAPLSYLVPAEPTVGSMIVLIGMAVGVDYTLFYLKREREERAKGHGTVDAVEIAAATSGHSILLSGGAVIASMAGLYVIGDATFNSLATGSILVVAIAVLGSITVLPALLAKLGRWVDRPRVPLLWRLNRRIGQGGISRRVLRPVTRHPVIALVALGSDRRAAGPPGHGPQAPLGQPRDPARRHRRGADLQGDDRVVPGRRHHRDRRGQGVRRRPAGRRRRPGRARGGRRRRRPLRRRRAGSARGLPGRHDLRHPARDAVRRVRRAGRQGDRAAADRPGAGSPRRPRRRVRRRRWRGRVARLRQPAEGPAAARDRHRAPADPADDGAGVPERADRPGVDAAEPGIGRGGVRDPDDRVPARLLRERARLQQPGLRHRLDPAVRDGGPGRAVDGLPRVRAQPGP